MCFEGAGELSNFNSVTVLNSVDTNKSRLFKILALARAKAANKLTSSGRGAYVPPLIYLPSGPKILVSLTLADSKDIRLLLQD